MVARDMEPAPDDQKNHHCDICAHPLPGFSAAARAVSCEQCGKSHTHRPKSVRKTLAFSLTALIFYVPANVFPFMTMELYGNRNSTTIWGGVVSLSDSGSWFLGVIVFLASILIPLVKLLVLFYLSATAKNNKHRRFKTHLYLSIEAIGRWSMLDIFLLAILVAMLKLGHWTTVSPEMGSWLFALVVIFTLLASASFDPTIIWKDAHETNG